MKDNTAAVHAQVPVDVATFLLNEKRVEINQLMTEEKVAAEIETFLDEAKRRAEVIVLSEV